MLNKTSLENINEILIKFSKSIEQFETKTGKDIKNLKKQLE